MLILRPLIVATIVATDGKFSEYFRIVLNRLIANITFLGYIFVFRRTLQEYWACISSFLTSSIKSDEGQGALIHHAYKQVNTRTYALIYSAYELSHVRVRCAVIEL